MANSIFSELEFCSQFQKIFTFLKLPEHSLNLWTKLKNMNYYWICGQIWKAGPFFNSQTFFEFINKTWKIKQHWICEKMQTFLKNLKNTKKMCFKILFPAFQKCSCFPKKCCVMDIILTIPWGVNIEAIISTVHCRWEYTQGIIHGQTLDGGGNILLVCGVLLT